MHTLLENFYTEANHDCPDSGCRKPEYKHKYITQRDENGERYSDLQKTRIETLKGKHLYGGIVGSGTDEEFAIALDFLERFMDEYSL